MNSSNLIQQSFIVSKLSQLTIVFPANIVAEILLIEREQILNLPFYEKSILGVIHHQSQIIPLVSLSEILGVEVILGGETLTVISLNNVVGELEIVGVVVGQILGSYSYEQLPSELFTNGKSLKSNMQLFQPEMLSSKLWLPYRWVS